MRVTAVALLDNDAYTATMAYNARHGQVYFGGVTYCTLFNSATDLGGNIRVPWA